MRKAIATSNRSAGQIESRFKRMNRNINSSFVALQASIGKAFATAAAVGGAVRLVDAATRIENSLKVAGLAGEDLERVYSRLRDAALRNAAPLESLVTLYGRAALVQKELGVTSEQLLQFSDTVALALRASGQSAAEASGALLQLSQALGSGTVRAEEFNSILEGAPTILQAAAAGIKEADGSVAKLRAIMLEGKLSSKALFDGFLAGSQVLEDKVAGSALTVSQALENLQTRLIDVARDFDKGTGASALLADGIEDLGTGIADLAVFLDNIVGPLQTFIGGMNDGIAAARGLANEISRITGLERLGFDAAVATNNLTGGAGLSASSSAAGRVIEQTFALVGKTPQDEALVRALAGDVPPEPIQVVVDGANPISVNDPQYKPTATKSGGSGKSPGDRYADSLADMQQRIAALNAETAAMSGLNPLINDYGFAIEKVRAALELENAARKAGIELGPKQMAQIDQLATAYAQATADAAKLAEQQGKISEAFDAMTDAAASAGSSLRAALSDGKVEGEELLDIVFQIGKALFGLSGFGSNPIGAFIGGILGFSSGGYTGNGGKNQPAGVVHKGEYVFSKDRTQQLGVANLERLHRGYANGGFVGSPGPVVGRPANDNNRLVVSVHLDSELLRAEVTDTAGRVVATAAPTIVQTSAKQAPLATSEYQARFGTRRFGT